MHLEIGKIYNEVNDGDNAIIYSKLAHLLFKKNKNFSKMQEALNFIESLTIKYEKAPWIMLNNRQDILSQN